MRAIYKLKEITSHNCYNYFISYGRYFCCNVEIYCNFAVTRVEIPDEYKTQDTRQDFCAVKNFIDTCCEINIDSETTTAHFDSVI